MLKLAGFFPDLRFCGLCQRESGQDETVRISEDGAMRCSHCNDRTGGELRPDSRRLIQAIIEQGPAQFISSPQERELSESGFIDHAPDRENARAPAQVIRVWPAAAGNVVK